MHVIILIIYITIINPTHSQLSLLESFELTPTNSTSSGISISDESPNGEVSITSDSKKWNIIASGPNSWHLLVSLSNQWGFHPTETSIITFEIKSPTSYTNDLAIAFTVPSSNKFIGIRLKMSGEDNRIVPNTASSDCPQTGATTIVNGNVVALVEAGSLNRASSLGMSFGQYDNPVTISGTDEEFPIKFILENIPDSYLGLTIQYGGNNGIMQYCQYQPMISYRGLLMYFAANSNGNTIDIESITVTYSAPFTSG